MIILVLELKVYFLNLDEKEILPYFIDFLKKLLKVDVYYRMNAD